jgi:hypothetical protein
MRVMATIAEPAVVRRVPDHLGLAAAPVPSDPAQPPASRTVASEERVAD